MIPLVKNCEKCQSPRLFSVQAEYGKNGNSSIPNLKLKYSDTLPNIPSVCSCSYVKFTLCLDCGIIQGYKPMSNEELDVAYKVAEYGDDWQEVLKEEEDTLPARQVKTPVLGTNSPWARWVK